MLPNKIFVQLGPNRGIHKIIHLQHNFADIAILALLRVSEWWRNDSWDNKMTPYKK